MLLRPYRSLNGAADFYLIPAVRAGGDNHANLRSQDFPNRTPRAPRNSGAGGARSLVLLERALGIRVAGERTKRGVFQA